MEFSQLLRAARQFERVFARRMAPVSERCGLTMGEIRILLFLANNPGCDTARDVVLVRGWASPRYPRQWICWWAKDFWSAVPVSGTGGSSI